jgi:hypothetical protein
LTIAEDCTIPGIALAGLRISPFLSTKHRHLLLRFTYEDDPFVLTELGQPFFGDFIFALSASKLHDGDVVLFYKSLDRFYELPADWRDQCHRGPCLLQMVADELDRTADVL